MIDFSVGLQIYTAVIVTVILFLPLVRRTP